MKKVILLLLMLTGISSGQAAFAQDDKYCEENPSACAAPTEPTPLPSPIENS